MRKPIAIAGAILAIAAISIIGQPAGATDEVVHTSTNQITNTPDNGCPPWARDTFVRSTTIVENSEGIFTVSFDDEGTFVTEGNVEGTLIGHVEFAPIAGELKSPEELANFDGDLFDNSAYPCKGDVPPERSTGQWTHHFINSGEATPAIVDWEWTYSTDCQSFTENANSSEAPGTVSFVDCPEDGQPGEPGPAGPTGPQGPQGEQGPAGSTVIVPVAGPATPVVGTPSFTG